MSKITLPSVIKLQASSAPAYGSMMTLTPWGINPNTAGAVTIDDLRKTVTPCPFSTDDVAALKAVAAPLRQAIGAPHEPIANLADLPTLILRLEHVTKKIEALITLHQP